MKTPEEWLATLPRVWDAKDLELIKLVQADAYAQGATDTRALRTLMIDIGNMTPAEQLALVQSWKDTLRRAAERVAPIITKITPT